VSPEALFLVAAVAGVGVLHTIVPDHWVPITLLARQRGWSRGETARVALRAGIGHVLSTLVIGLAVWAAGVAFATRFGTVVDTAASLALVGFGLWIAISAWREMRGGGGHGHSHGHSHGVQAAGGVHGPELQQVETGHGTLMLSIFEDGVPPRFRLTGVAADRVGVETRRAGGARQSFEMVERGGYWESAEEIPEPHGFGVTVTADHGGDSHRYETAFAEHEHHHKTSSRTALMLILGSSPMVEGIPAFFAAGKYGLGVIVLMAVVFAISTIATYVVLCVSSAAGLQRVRFGAFERYGEVLSGAFIALVGVAFWVWPVL